MAEERPAAGAPRPSKAAPKSGPTSAPTSPPSSQSSPKPAPAKKASQPAGSTVPGREAGPSKPAGREAGKLLDPLSYNEARKGLYAAHRGAARLLGSQVQLEASDFDEMGDAFKDIADRFPGIRILLRVVAPLILVGALFEVWRRILAETSWWQRLRERQRSQQEENEAALARAQAAAPTTARAQASPATPQTRPAGAPPSTEHPVQVAAPVPAPEQPDPSQAPPLPRRGPALHRLAGLR